MGPTTKLFTKGKSKEEQSKEALVNNNSESISEIKNIYDKENVTPNNRIAELISIIKGATDELNVIYSSTLPETRGGNIPSETRGDNTLPETRGGNTPPKTPVFGIEYLREAVIETTNKSRYSTSGDIAKTVNDNLGLTRNDRNYVTPNQISKMLFELGFKREKTSVKGYSNYRFNVEVK